MHIPSQQYGGLFLRRGSDLNISVRDHFLQGPIFEKSLYHLYSTLLRITPQPYGYIFAHPKLEAVIGESALKFIPFRRFPKQLSGEDYAETHVTRRSGVKVVHSLAETYCNQWDDGCTGARA